jgi:sulfonate transport system ATP-binding protein
MSAQLQVRVVRKAFGTRVVLENVRVDVREREVVALIGPSGCGKSTLLRIAAGLERDYFGEVMLENSPVVQPRRALGIMFQEPRLLPWLTNADNVAFGDRHSKESRQRAVGLLDEVGLREFADAFPKQLSEGMAQRVALSRALFRQPTVMLLDAPFSAVDALTRIILQDLLLELARRHFIAVLVVTHNIEEALILADRVVVMQSTPGARVGEIVNLRPPRSLQRTVLDRLRVSTAAEPRGTLH